MKWYIYTFIAFKLSVGRLDERASKRDKFFGGLLNRLIGFRLFEFCKHSAAMELTLMSHSVSI